MTRLRLRRPHKYGAKKKEIDGYVFDSQAEARRYEDLKLMEKHGDICKLEVHPKFTIEINDFKVCDVILDFCYYDNKDHRTVWEDVKGKDTALSRLKRKLVRAAHGVEVEVIRV